MGGKRRFTVSRVEFAGYGLDAPGAAHMDFRGKDVKDAVVVWLGASGPKGVDGAIYRRLLMERGRYATEQRGAAASIGPEMASGAGRAGRAGGPEPAGDDTARGGQPPAAGGQGFGRGAPLPTPDFTTVQRLDTAAPPVLTASDAFLEFLFSAAPSKYDETITFNVDADYQIVRTQLSHNVVGILEGSDSRLKDSYVAFGAHYDHVGYAEGEVTLHPDYHANTDEVSKIEFDKMTRIVQLVYETGQRVANLDHAPVRDWRGARAGRLTRH
jgi:hypothetical protein